MALDMATGKVLWNYQAHAGDAFLGGCGMPNQPENCPADNGPDLDIGNSPVLHTLANGKRIVVAGTKDGNVFALDPDKKGAVSWDRSVAPNPKGTPLQTSGRYRLGRRGGSAEHLLRAIGRRHRRRSAFYRRARLVHHVRHRRQTRFERGGRFGDSRSRVRRRYRRQNCMP